MFVVGCGESGNTADSPPVTQDDIDGATADTTTTTPPTETTYPIEVVKFAEAYGATLEEAAVIFYGQLSQEKALQRLYGMVGEG